MSPGGRGASSARRFTSQLATFAATILIVSFLAAALVRYSPGYGVDPCVFDPLIDQRTCLVLQQQNQASVSLPLFYLRYLNAAMHGDYGESESLQRPVSELFRSRAAVSASLLLWGTLGGLAFGGLLAWLAVWPGDGVLRLPAVVVSGLTLAVPPAVLALFLFFREWPLWVSVALALMPRVFGTARALLNDLYLSPALLAARARGLGGLSIAMRYVVLPAAPQLAALAGVALVMGFGFLIPIEALCDVPGIGQLTWIAAGKRDLPLLSALALLISTVVASVEWLGDLSR